jgi:hypothetical protein
VSQFVTRRRVPRRNFKASVGVLCNGQFTIGKSLQVGEGGMSVTVKSSIKVQDRVLLTFQVPEGSIVCVRALVRYIDQTNLADQITIGVQFENLGFNFKRELRNLVAQATQENIF